LAPLKKTDQAISSGKFSQTRLYGRRYHRIVRKSQEIVVGTKTDSSEVRPQTVAEILELKDSPVVAIDQAGLFTFVNDSFEKTYGYTAKELIGQSVTQIMPPYMRDAHRVGFARYLTTEHATLLGKALALPVFYKDGRTADAEHFILGEKLNGDWRFAAIIKTKD
jgi:PAS domain S-box-containing protein